MNFRLLFLLSLVCFFCGPKRSIKNDKILVKINDIVITSDEFIRRAEYTIRPSFCKGNQPLHKKIVLNNLIAEKLACMEFKKDTNLNKALFKNYLLGRKEQAMRQVYFYEQAYKKVEASEEEIKKDLKVFGRTYSLEYYQIPLTPKTLDFLSSIKENPFLYDSIHYQTTGSDTIPYKEISYLNTELKEIDELLFSKEHAKGEILEPIVIENKSVLLTRIKGWKDKKPLSDEQTKQAWNDVKSKLKETKALSLFKKKVGLLMKGKKLKFYDQTFKKLVESIAPLYYNQEMKNDFFLNAVFQKNTDSSLALKYETSLEKLRKAPLFTLDDEIWTVEHLENELQKHPLVFRRGQFPRHEFAHEFKLAVADAVRDRFITEEAYQLNYNESPIVEHNEKMWKEALEGELYRNKIISSLPDKDSLPRIDIIDKYLKVHFDSLQNKYTHSIEINTDLFEKLKLTTLDMIATQKNVPYPIVVPSFPCLTTDNRLDYGKKTTP